MEQHIGLTILSSLVSLIGLSYLLFWRYRKYRVDVFRQEMFALRDEFFDEADSGLIDFNHRAYGILRSTMNGYIRFGHRLTFWHLLFLGLVVRKSVLDKEVSFNRAWTHATAKLDDETKGKLNAYRDRMDMLAAKHILLGTPEVIVFLPLFIMMAVIVWVTRKGFSNIDDAALIYGEQASA